MMTEDKVFCMVAQAQEFQQIKVSCPVSSMSTCVRLFVISEIKRYNSYLLKHNMCGFVFCL